MEDIMLEIKDGVKKFDIGEIQFEDDTITARKKKFDRIVTVRKIGLPWCTPSAELKQIII